MSRSLVAELASRVQEMEGRIPGAGSALPVASALRPLLPQGLLAGSYAVQGSLGLATALLAEVSAGGEWCGVVGIPEFGAEAAALLGVDLTRTLLVPDPQQEWLTVVATLVEVMPIVLARPPGRLAPKDLARLDARIRAQGSVLVALVDRGSRWPRATASLDVGPSEWSGITSGRGVLTEREVLVRVTDRWGQSRAVRLRQRGGLFVEARAESALRAVG